MYDHKWQACSSLTHVARLLAHTTAVLDNVLYHDNDPYYRDADRRALQKLMSNIYAGIASLNSTLQLFTANADMLRTIGQGLTTEHQPEHNGAKSVRNLHRFHTRDMQ
jgi:hypothetical protein